MKAYEHLKLEKKWQNEWEKKGIYHASNNSKKKKYYSLIEFPYPSGDGLHVGHPRPYIGMDVISRKKRLEGYNVLYPIGWDAFGLPTENYAIKTGKDPRVVTKKNSENFKRQIKSLGISFDWSREINTTDPKYYKWTQWIFLQFLKEGLAYKAKIAINWCSKDKIGLANEEVIAGNCERCGSPVEKREKEQWMLGITKYAERLDKDLDTVDYLPHIKLAQKNWIGKSEGAEIEFKIQNPSPALPEGEGEMPRFFTTRPELWQALQERALEMRKNPTRGEKAAWDLLRRNNLSPALPEGEGENSKRFHFRRQHIIDRFVVDFVCIEKKLVIEIDGDIHDYTKAEDKERTEMLNQIGFEVIRFSNEEVIKNKKDVLKKIILKLNSVSSKALSFGEGLGGVELGSIKVFTTRPDTIFGATYLAVAPELAKKLVDKDFGIKTDTEKENKPARNATHSVAGGEKTGKDTGLRAKNPATGAEIPVWVVNYVSADYGTGAIMAVPAHDERDFEFANKFSLPIQYVVAEKEIEKLYPPKKDHPFIYRKSVECYLRNPRTDEFLLINWKAGANWKSPVTGGVEEGEDIIEAARREIYEETGYKNLKFIQTLGNPMHASFWHPQKNENRNVDFWGVYFELENEEKDEISTEEQSRHDVVWVKRNQVVSFLTTNTTPFSRIGKKDLFYADVGVLVNSGQFNGLDSEKAKKEIIKFVGGKEKTTFKLRDWVFSRQRYWGEPIPVIFCDKCGTVPVPEKDLPIELPKVKNYLPTDSGESPLANISKWVNTTCPTCGKKAKRETDTMPNWAGSSWYYLAYCMSRKAFSGKASLGNWKLEIGNYRHFMPVDWYNGGNEHTTLHLLYSRFWHKFLYDLKLVPTPEPYKKRTSHGLILAEGGEKMSKSKGNVINPDDIVKRYGADTMRLYEMFMGPFDQAIAWSEEAIVGPRRFLERVWNLQYRVKEYEREIYSWNFEKLTQKVSNDIEAMKFNTAISALMIFVNDMEKKDFIQKGTYEKFLILLSPFAPHITEEIWQILGHKKSICLESWPKADLSMADQEEVTIVVQIGGKVRGQFKAPRNINAIEASNIAENLPEIKKWLEGANIKSVHYVPGRLINIVV